MLTSDKVKEAVASETSGEFGHPVTKTVLDNLFLSWILIPETSHLHFCIPKFLWAGWCLSRVMSKDISLQDSPPSRRPWWPTLSFKVQNEVVGHVHFLFSLPTAPSPKFHRCLFTLFNLCASKFMLLCTVFGPKCEGDTVYQHFNSSWSSQW